jgi:nucleoside-diphosphate-sugar epimerase
MRVIVAGATGTLGVPLVQHLVTAGHTVSGIARTREGAERLRQLGASAITADVMDRDRLLRAANAALERGHGGQAYNVVDDTPATFRELVTRISETWHAPTPLVVPGWLLSLAAPYGGSVLAGVSMFVSNAKAKQELGWTPRYPSFRDGIRRATQ